MGRFFATMILMIGVPTANAEVNISPFSVSFGNTPVSSSQSTTVWITNEGSKSVDLNVSNTCPSDFDIMSMCDLPLNQGNMCSIEIHFSPRQVGHQSCDLWIYDSNDGSQTLSVDGDGTEARNATLPFEAFGICFHFYDCGGLRFPGGFVSASQCLSMGGHSIQEGDYCENL